MTAYIVASSVTVTATGSLGVGAPAYAPLNVTGSVGVSGISATITTTGSLPVSPSDGAVFPVTWAGSGSLPVYPGDGAIFNTSQQGQVSVNNFPATQSVSGTVYVTQTGSFHVTVDNQQSITQPLEIWQQGTVGVSGTVGVYTSGLQGVSGTVTAIIGNWPAILGVSASAPLQVWNEGNVGVSGSVSISNFPTIQAVSGTVTASVTFPSNQQVWTAGTVGVSGSVGAVIQNWPARLGVSASAQLPVFSTGPVGVTASAAIPVFNGGPVGISASTTLSVQGVAGGVSIQTWNVGPAAVSGTVTANVTVTGSTGVQVGAPAYAPLFTQSPPASTATRTTMTGSGIAAVALALNTGRLGATFFTDVANPGNFLLAFGATPTTGSFDVRLPPGAYYELPFHYVGQVQQISDVADAGELRIVEFSL